MEPGVALLIWLEGAGPGPRATLGEDMWKTVVP